MLFEKFMYVQIWKVMYVQTWKTYETAQDKKTWKDFVEALRASKH